MVNSGTLYTYADSFRGIRCRIAAAYSGADLKVSIVNAGDKTHKYVPNFESTDKKMKLEDANAVAFYLSNDEMRGTSLDDSTRILNWMSFGSSEVASAVASWVYPALSLVETTPALLGRATADVRKVFSFLNEHLKTRTFLATERLTLADVCVAADLLLAYQHVADATFRKPYDNVNRWFLTVVNQKQFKDVTGEVKVCEKAAVFDAAKFEENKKAAKAEKPKAEKPKAEKKPAAKKVEAAAEEEEESFDDAPKNDPFAALPKGTFIMDEFKRTYSNDDTEKVAIPYFWSKFDKECYSMWFCEYKYADELALTFMSSNLVGGMFQRIERLRKNAFGSMCVFGENNNNTICGVWVWKGQELAFPLCPDWTTDYESYTWRKMNPDDESDRKLFNQFCLWEGDFKGKKFNSGKIFK